MLRKIRSNKGVSIVLAMLMLFVCFMIASTVVAAGATNRGRTKGGADSQQKYLYVKSALEYVCGELSHLQYESRYYLRSEIKENGDYRMDIRLRPGVMSHTASDGGSRPLGLPGDITAELGRDIDRDIAFRYGFYGADAAFTGYHVFYGADLGDTALPPLSDGQVDYHVFALKLSGSLPGGAFERNSVLYGGYVVIRVHIDDNLSMRVTAETNDGAYPMVATMPAVITPGAANMISGDKSFTDTAIPEGGDWPSPTGLIERDNQTACTITWDYNKLKITKGQM